MNVARDIFGRQTRITYIDLCEQLQQVLDIKERTAKSYIRFMRERHHHQRHGEPKLFCHRLISSSKERKLPVGVWAELVYF